MDESRAPTLWYTRRGTVVQGPFPAGLIRRYVILGRVRMSDELSRDLEHWTPLEALPELIPDMMQVVDDPRMQRRLLAAKRWEDERRHGDRRGADADASQERRIPGERRQEDPDMPPRSSPPGDEVAHEVHPHHRRALIAVLVAIIVAAAVFLIQSRPVELEGGADCRQAPQPGIDWSSCPMEGRNLNGADLAGAHMSNMALGHADLGSATLRGADLSFSNLSLASLRAADLSSARLTGASLRGADLSGARLEDADLTYADFTGANLSAARLAGARLDHAVWVDGHECPPGSVGDCSGSP